MPLNPADGYPETPYTYAEFAGDIASQSLQFLRDIDAAMRANYATNIVNIGNNIYPILYAESTFDGGRYTLAVNEHTSYVKQNVGAIYDVAKAVSHIPLGIFSIISGYGTYPNFDQWAPSLKTYRDQIQLAQANFTNIQDFVFEFKASLDMICLASLEFIDQILSKNAFTYSDFAAYSHSINQQLFYMQGVAAQNQVDVMTATLQDWKAMLGEELWDKLYVVSNAVWTLTKENAHELIIKAQMKESLRETNVIVTEAAPTLDDAKTLLGRIVGDRIIAELVFDKDFGEAYRQNIYSLSTRRDLLSQAIEKIVGNVDLAAMCPHMNS